MTVQPAFYIDTSAYLGILLNDPLTDDFLKKMGKKPICSSILLLLEAERNLVRMSREGKLSMNEYTKTMERLKEDTDTFILKEVDLDIVQLCRFPAVSLPKTSDLIHLRTALWFKEEINLEAFITLDKDQKKSAIEMGLCVM